MRLLITFCSALVLAACSHTGVQSRTEPKPKSPKDAAIAKATEDLRHMGINPDSKKLTVSKVMSGESYFKTRPKNEYWDRGRKAVGSAFVYMVTFSESTPSLGGNHQYLYHSKTHQLLWVAHSK